MIPIDSRSDTSDVLSLSSSGWRTWTPLEALAPRFHADVLGGRDGGPALVIEGGGNPAVYGEWRHQLGGIVGDGVYRFAARYRTDGVAHPREQVTARVEWMTSPKRDEDFPTYTLPVDRQGEWIECEHLVHAPPDAHGAMIRLGLRWSAQGTVRWDAVTLQRQPTPPQRLVRLGTIAHRPHGTASSAASVAEFVDLLARHAPRDMDVVCLPEGITLIGTGRSFADVAEPVPGPTTAALGQLASTLRCYVVAGLYERVGSTLYNTAVLLDRRGQLVGTYRKTHLPQPEADAGLTPGADFPVFDTDFGRIGIMICWDVQFPEPARALAARGAEIILLPIWGGNDLLARARAIENHAVLVSSSYDMRSFIVDPVGEVLAETSADQPVATATVDLARRIVQPWLGDLKTATWAERRSDLQP